MHKSYWKFCGFGFVLSALLAYSCFLSHILLVPQLSTNSNTLLWQKKKLFWILLILNHIIGRSILSKPLDWRDRHISLYSTENVEQMKKRCLLEMFEELEVINCH